MRNNFPILILGATGMVGTAVEEICSRRKVPYVTLTHSDLEITELEKLTDAIGEHKPGAVINCVAVPNIDSCEKSPDIALALHCNAVLHLAKECAKSDITLVQPSSHAVFDGFKEGPYGEDDLVKATSVYAATKLLSEKIVAVYCPKHYITRFPTLYGPRRNKSVGFVDKVIAWIKEGREIRIADDKMDSPTYSIDAASAVISLFFKNAPYGIYHIANQGWISYYDFVQKIQKLMGTEIIIHRAKDREFSSNCYKPLRTALKTIRLEPLRNYESALREYISTYVSEGSKYQAKLAWN